MNMRSYKLEILGGLLYRGRDGIQDSRFGHCRGGLTEEEAIELGLPVKDYSLKTLEDKIVI
jgi:hypothetical protein